MGNDFLVCISRIRLLTLNWNSFSNWCLLKYFKYWKKNFIFFRRSLIFYVKHHYIVWWWSHTYEFKLHFVTHSHCLECAQKFIERQHRIHKIQNIWNLKFWQLWLAIIYQGTFSFFAFSCFKTLPKIFRMDDILTTCATTQNILDSLFMKNYLFHRKLKIKWQSGSHKI